MTLTTRQTEILDFIRESTAKHGYSPTFREIRDNFGFASINSVTTHVRALERKGYIQKQASPRTITICKR